MVYFSGMRPTAIKMLRIFYFVVLKLYNVKIKFVGIDISVVNSTYCSCRGQELGGSQIGQMTLVLSWPFQGCQMNPSAIYGCLHAHTHTHTRTDRHGITSKKCCHEFVHHFQKFHEGWAVSLTVFETMQPTAVTLHLLISHLQSHLQVIFCFRVILS